MSLKRNAAAFGVGAAVAALYVLSHDDETKDALRDAFEDIREGVAGAIERVRAAADAIVERVPLSNCERDDIRKHIDEGLPAL